MRKGLLALVVLLALAALALMFWPREIERSTPAPAGNASVVMPAAPLPEEDGGKRAARAPERVEAPAAKTVTPPAADRVHSPSEDPVAEPAAGSEAGAGDARDAAEPAGTSNVEDAAEQLAALSPPGATLDPPPPESPAAAGDEGTEDEAAVVDREAPVLDLVRVAPDGQAVIAGRALPNATVEILLDEVVVGTVEAGADGGFVAILDTEASAEPREMRLRVPRAAPSGAEAPAAATAAPAPAAGAAHPGDPAGTEDFALSAPVTILPGAGPDAAPVVVARGAEEIDVVQPGAVEDPERMALDRLTYETGGDLIAAGRGPGTRTVRAYADGELVAEVPVGADGAWRAVIPHAVAEATSLLRFDEIGGDGAVVSRLEAPFAYAEEGSAHELRKRDVVIERGANLWRIAEQHYGEGLRYSVIFEANAGLIRNPDLIYPGQVLAIPELVEAE